MDHPLWWSKWINNSTENIALCHQFVVQEVASSIPSLFIRYEDLIRDPAFTLEEIFRFVFDVQSIEGTLLERKISEVCESLDDKLTESRDCMRMFSKSSL